MKPIVILNSKQVLLEEQERLMREKFGDYDVFYVPADGWSEEIIDEVEDDIFNEWDTVVFACSVPLLIRNLSVRMYRVFVFFNKNANANTGWKIL